MQMISKVQTVLNHTLTRLFIVFEFILLLRVGLIFFHANPATLAVLRFYDATSGIVAPFRAIFPDMLWQGGILDITTISAMVGYAIIFFVCYLLIGFAFTAIEKLTSRV